MSERCAWIGLLHVKPREGNNVTDGLYSFVNVVAFATDAGEYATIAVRLLNAMDFDVLQLEDIEPWSSRLQHSSPDQEIRDLVDDLSDETFAAYSTFYSYDPENE